MTSQATMALTPTTEEYYQIRRKVGTLAPTDEVLNSTFDRQDGSVDATVAEILETRFADLASQPDSFTVVGEYSQSTGKQMEALGALVTRSVGGRSLHLVRTDDVR